MSDFLNSDAKSALSGFKAELNRLADRTSLSKILQVIGLMMKRSIVKNFQVGGRPEKWHQSGAAAQRFTMKKQKNKATGTITIEGVEGKTMAKSGTLMRSIEFESNNTDTVRIGITGEAQKYGVMLNTGNNGKPIRPTKAKALTIPVCKEAQGKAAREIQGLFRLGKTNLLVVKKGKTDFKAMFALKKSIQPKKYEFLLIQPEDQSYINEYLISWYIHGKLP